MIPLQVWDGRGLARAVAELAEDRPRVLIERLLSSLDGPTIFSQLVDELGPSAYVEDAQL